MNNKSLGVISEKSKLNYKLKSAEYRLMRLNFWVSWIVGVSGPNPLGNQTARVALRLVLRWPDQIWDQVAHVGPTAKFKKRENYLKSLHRCPMHNKGPHSSFVTVRPFLQFSVLLLSDDIVFCFSLIMSLVFLILVFSSSSLSSFSMSPSISRPTHRLCGLSLSPTIFHLPSILRNPH